LKQLEREIDGLKKERDFLQEKETREGIEWQRKLEEEREKCQQLSREKESLE